MSMVTFIILVFVFLFPSYFCSNCVPIYRSMYVFKLFSFFVKEVQE